MRIRFITFLSLALAVSAQAQTARRGTLIVTNKGAATASLISLGSGRVVAELPTGDGPHEVATSHDGRIAVVTDYGARTGGSTLTVIDVAARRVARTVDLGSYTRPHGVMFLPGDSIVVVTSEATQNVVFVRVADGRVIRAIPTGQNGSHMLAVTAAADRIFTSNVPQGSVSEIDVAQGRAVRMYPVPAGPEAITVTDSGDEVWVGSNTQGVVSVVKTSDGSVETVASGFGWPYRILITPGRRLVLIPDYRGEALRILDFATRAERARLAFPGGGPQGVTISGDGRTAFLSMSAHDRVAIIDLETMTVVGYVPAGTSPDGVAWSAIELP